MATRRKKNWVKEITYMKLKYLASLTFLTVVAGCSSTPAPTMQSGDDAELTYEGLVRVNNTIMDSVWAAPDIDLTGYRKVIFLPVGVSYRDVEPADTSGALRRSTRSRTTELREFQLDEETKAAFEAEIGAAFREEVSASEVYTIVDEPGPDVLMIGVALLDVVSRVPPQAATQPRVFIEMVGEATLVLEIRGSMSNTIYARAVDRRAAQQQSQMIESNRVTNTAEIRRLGRRWGQIVRAGLDALLTDGVGS
jgi:hypothetical protein